MAPVEADGTFTKRSQNDVMAALINAMRTQFGQEVDVTPTGTIRKFLEACTALGIAETEATMDNLFKQMFFETATGDNLDKLLEVAGFKRRQAERAAGLINITLNTAMDRASNPDPFFPIGSLVFVDAAGRKYELAADLRLPVVAGTAITASVRALTLGSTSNISTDGIVDVEFGSATYSTRWNTNVASFTNSAAFAGGQERETDKLFRQRVRNSFASKPQGSLDGIIAAIQLVPGVFSVNGIENDTDIGGTENLILDNSGYAGTPSEAIGIGQTYTRIEQKLVVTARRFVQNFTVRVTHGGTAPIMKVALCEDLAGDAGAELPNMVLENFEPADLNVASSGVWPLGRYLDPGTYHIVYEPVVGSCTFDGATTGTANQVKVWNGSAWVLSGAVENIRTKVVGGVPPHGFRLFVSGGGDDDVAQGIWGVKAAGIRSDGLTVGTAIDRAGRDQMVYFERPTITPVKVTVTVKRTSSFVGNEDFLRDIIIDYIGGTDTKSAFHIGLTVGVTLVRNEIIRRLLDDSFVVGLSDVTTLTLARKPDTLGVVNLVPVDGEQFYVEDPADLIVTISE